MDDKIIISRVSRVGWGNGFHFTEGDNDTPFIAISTAGLTLDTGAEEKVFHPIEGSWVKSVSMWKYYCRQIAILSTLGLIKLSLEDDPSGSSLTPLKDRVASKAFRNTGFLFYRYAPDEKVLYFRHKDHPEYIFFHDKDHGLVFGCMMEEAVVDLSTDDIDELNIPDLQLIFRKLLRGD